jgi:hypothetical protein
MSIVAAANLVAVGLVAAPSQAQDVSLCSGTAENFTIAGDLAVPAGASCNLINVTVTGDVVVRADANLALDASTVGGDLTIRSNGFVAATESTVQGTTALRQAFGLATDHAELGGLDARNSEFVFSEATRHGEVFSRNGQTVILAGWVEGDLRTNGDLLTDVDDTVVTGGFTVNQAETGTVICRSEIDGETVLRNSGGLIQLGDEAPVLGCEFNVFADRVVLRDNAAQIRISDNVIRGDLVCTGNDPVPTGADNRLRGRGIGDCADLAPVGLGLARALTPTTIDSRTAPMRAQIEVRSASAAAAAAAAGPANL